MKRRDIDFAPEAKADLLWIYETIGAASGPDVAFRYIERIEQACMRLDIGSERGTPRDDVRVGLRVIGFERTASIAFVVQDHRVVIVRLHYGGVNWTETLS